jgi:hypothetical protein
MRRAIIFLSLFLTACGGTAVVPTNTPAPTATTSSGRGPAAVNTVAPPTAAPVVIPTNTPAPLPATATPAPPPPATNTPIPPASVVFTSVQGARPFGTASVRIKGPTNTQCTIAYTTPAGTHSTAQGLVPRTTDGDGVAAWSWVIGSSTRPGTGHVDVRCGAAAASTNITIG